MGAHQVSETTHRLRAEEYEDCWHKMHNTGRRELRQNNTGQETVSENGVCLNTPPSDTARFRAVSVPSY